mmetsp:Transcript_35419/g.65078  ORF Transcript_35419/g.65078 Transcript_35419/m.65078 type:complete len:202 (-) Transcript_35419:191-796(-)
MCCLKYVCCPCLCCCPPKRRKEENQHGHPTAGDDPKAEALIESPTTAEAEQLSQLSPEEKQDYEDLRHLAMKRDIKCNIRKSTQAGVAAGLTVMAGTIVAGPMGAVVGGAVGTAMAAKISKNVVPLNDLLEQTPPGERREVLKAFNEAFQEEFNETIRENPELKLLFSGASIFGVVRYMVDRELVQSEQLERLDGILSKVA